MLQRHLQFLIVTEPQDAPFRRGFLRGFGRMRCDCGKRLAQRRRRLGLCRFRFRLRDKAKACGAIQHAIARRTRRVGVAIRPSRFRRLRQRDEQGLFGCRQPSRLLSKISNACGAQALEIASVRRKGEVDVQNLIFREPLFELQRARHLAQLCSGRALVARLKQARRLHCQRRSARDHAAMADELDSRARQRPPVHAVMGCEATVFINLQHREKARIDVCMTDRQTPATVIRRERAQQAPIAINRDR